MYISTTNKDAKTIFKANLRYLLLAIAFILQGNYIKNKHKKSLLKEAFT